ERRPGGNATRAERRHVVDAPARHAGEVVVRIRVAVESCAADLRPLAEQALGGQHPQIAIDGGQAHPRRVAPDLAVHHCGRRMRVGPSYELEDEAAGPGQTLAARAQRIGLDDATAAVAPALLATDLLRNDSQLHRRARILPAGW